MTLNPFSIDPFSIAWPLMARAAADHLWQSTVFLLSVGILTLVLRNNRAEIRYRLWMVASIKFLFPFAILTNVGSYLAKRNGDSARGNSDFYISMEQISEPFNRSAMPVNLSAEHHAASLSFVHLLPMILLTVWLCGVAAVLCLWYLRWRQISAAIRNATPLEKGREVEALRGLESLGGVHKPIQLLLSRSSLEPGIFGIYRPILIWPAGISERLNDAQLQAILAHEVWHVRRRDNLTAAIHMVVEAIFWFHPLTWWLGARLVEERERACDEEVLRSGGEPQAYAEGILNVCKFYTEAPLACVSGVTGGSLKRRIAQIMTQPFASNLSTCRKILLAGIGIAAVVGPIAFGLMRSPQTTVASAQSTEAPTPVFKVISIKQSHSGPDGFHGWHYDADGGNVKITNATTKSIVEWAYGLQPFQLSGGPDWSGSERYDIKLEEKNRNVSQQGQHRVLKTLLADRFKLEMKEEKKVMPIYGLVHGSSELKMLKEKVPGGGAHIHFNIDAGGGKMTMRGVSSADLANELTHQLNRIVVDRTGLQGFYDLNLEWTPDNDDSLITAVQDQLGLRLEPETGPVPTYVIEQVEKPVEK